MERNQALIGTCRVVIAETSDLDSVAPLFQDMVEHHRRVAGSQWPVRDAEEAWERRRVEYTEWLARGNAWLLLAQPTFAATPGVPLGYAFVRVHEPGATWELGEEVGELESLSVAAEARGSGIGTLLIEHARRLLRERGISHWSVGVVEANTAAVRLYEREGFRPYYRNLLARL
jgi:ribosomal protein S18 acetylase RimI-like enzyme